jgi:hypothetical protein
VAKDQEYPERDTVLRLAKRMGDRAIPYALIGGIAVRMQGARSQHSRVEILLTPLGLDHFRQDLVGTVLDQEPHRSRRFVDRKNGVPVEVKVTGHYPGTTSPGPFTFPDPTISSVDLDGVSVVSLPWLVQLQLAAGRFDDLADVVSLIQAHRLNESYLDQLHPAVHSKYMNCLEEKLREDEWEAQGG